MPKGTIGTTNQTLRWTMGVIGPRINAVMRHEYRNGREGEGADQVDIIYCLQGGICK